MGKLPEWRDATSRIKNTGFYCIANVRVTVWYTAVSTACARSEMRCATDSQLSRPQNLQLC
jgi:hypothetical protein